jgi:hypothetical protein
MYGPDPFTSIAYARMLAEEQERDERRRPRRPRDDEAAAVATQPRAVPNGRLGAVRALFSRPAAALRWHGRPRQAS